MAWVSGIMDEEEDRDYLSVLEQIGGKVRLDDDGQVVHPLNPCHVRTLKTDKWYSPSNLQGWLRIKEEYNSRLLHYIKRCGGVVPVESGPPPKMPVHMNARSVPVHHYYLCP